MTILIQDNEWHNAIIADHADGSFGIYDDEDDAEATGKDKLRRPLVYSNIEYNWNRGKPIVKNRTP